MSFDWAFHVSRMMNTVGDAYLPLHAVAALTDLVPFDHTGVFVFRRHHKPRDILARHYDGTFHQKYCSRSYQLDPFYKGAHERRDGGVFRMPELDPGFFHYLDGYEMGPRVLDIIGLASQPARDCASRRLAEEVGYLLPIQDGFVVHVAMIRSTEAGAFSDDELAKFRTFWPVIQAAFSLHFRSIGGARPVEDAASEDGEPDRRSGWLDPRLTPRERDIMRLVATGLSSLQIAQHLEISVETVKVHRKNAYRKLGISTRAEVWALERREH